MNKRIQTLREQYDPEGKLPKRGSQEVLTELLQEKGINRYAELGGSSEGDVLPGDVDEVSGYILAEDGKVYAYWLGWDPEKESRHGNTGYYTLGENRYFTHEGQSIPFFREVPPGDEEYPKPNNYAFVEAKKELGIR